MFLCWNFVCVIVDIISLYVIWFYICFGLFEIIVFYFFLNRGLRFLYFSFDWCYVIVMRIFWLIYLDWV